MHIAKLILQNMLAMSTLLSGGQSQTQTIPHFLMGWNHAKNHVSD